MTVRNVKKNLAGQQDLLPGLGPYEQIRRGQTVTVDGPAKSYFDLFVRSYAEAGLPVKGTFEDGCTLATVDDISIYLAEGKGYSYSGTLPHTTGVEETPIGNPLWVDKSATLLKSQLSAWKDVGDIRGWGALEGVENASVTTAAINATYAARAGKTVIIPALDIYINSTIYAGYSNTVTNASGAKITATFDGLMFDLNPSANPSAIETTTKSYIYWTGGEFKSSILNPVNAVAFRVYGIRQATIEKCIFGHSGQKRLNSGIQIAGLGGHSIINNRFLLVDKCIDSPAWATSSTDVAGHVTTSSFIRNNFMLGAGQKAFDVRGGWNRWIIQGGFVNGSGVPTFHFTNYGDCKGLNIIGIGFEQAAPNGKFLYIEDTSGLSASSINVSGAIFNGDPTAGGHIAIDLERCINVSIGSASRVEGSIARNNRSIRADVNCQDIVIDASCRLPDKGVELLMPRNQAVVGKYFNRIFDMVLSGYNGDAKSSGTVTLDMATLMGTNYPRQVAPLAYELTVQARDSGSAASTTTAVEIMRNLTSGATFRQMVDLRGVPNDQRVAENIHVNAEADGSIALQFYASGAGTLDVWIYVTGVYN